MAAHLWNCVQCKRLRGTTLTQKMTDLLPTADDIFATLSAGKLFTKIDLSTAFNQLKVDDNSRQYLTINTTKGLFQPTRLPYGIKTAPLMFQNVMEFQVSVVTSMTY